MYTIGSFLYVIIPYGISSFNFFASGGFRFAKIILQGCKLNRIFLYFRVRGKVQHSDPPPSLYCKSPLQEVCS